MSLLKHVAEIHFEDPSERHENKSEDKAILNIEAFIKQHDHCRGREAEKDSSFVFEEAMLFFYVFIP